MKIFLVSVLVLISSCKSEKKENALKRVRESIVYDMCLKPVLRLSGDLGRRNLYNGKEDDIVRNHKFIQMYFGDILWVTYLDFLEKLTGVKASDRRSLLKAYSRPDQIKGAALVVQMYDLYTQSDMPFINKCMNTVDEVISDCSTKYINDEGQETDQMSYERCAQEVLKTTGWNEYMKGYNSNLSVFFDKLHAQEKK